MPDLNEPSKPPSIGQMDRVLYKAPEYNLRAYWARKEIRGKDELVDKILDNPKGPEAQLYAWVVELHENKIKRKYLESCLIASNDQEEVAKLLELPLELVQMYSKMYYDISEYDLLSKLELLEKPRDKDEIILKTWALHQGLAFIAWRLGKRIDINPQQGLVDLFNLCINKSKEALFNSNASMASVESTKWAKLSIEIGRLLKLWIIDSASAKKDLELAIREVVPEFESLDDIKREDIVLEDILQKEGIKVDPLEGQSDIG
jgi:hypothetical protein